MMLSLMNSSRLMSPQSKDARVWSERRTRALPWSSPEREREGTVQYSIRRHRGKGKISISAVSQAHVPLRELNIEPASQRDLNIGRSTDLRPSRSRYRSDLRPMRR